MNQLGKSSKSKQMISLCKCFEKHLCKTQSIEHLSIKLSHYNFVIVIESVPSISQEKSQKQSYNTDVILWYICLIMLETPRKLLGKALLLALLVTLPADQLHCKQTICKVTLSLYFKFVLSFNQLTSIAKWRHEQVVAIA